MVRGTCWVAICFDMLCVLRDKNTPFLSLMASVRLDLRRSPMKPELRRTSVLGGPATGSKRPARGVRVSRQVIVRPGRKATPSGSLRDKANQGHSLTH